MRAAAQLPTASNPVCQNTREGHCHTQDCHLKKKKTLWTVERNMPSNTPDFLLFEFLYLILLYNLTKAEQNNET